MIRAVGIRFKQTGAIYYFDCGAFVLNVEDKVIVEIEQGLSVGTVVVSSPSNKQRNSSKPLKKVFRLVTEKDCEQLKKNRDKERIAYKYCLKCIQKLYLKMSLFSVDKFFDDNKLIFFFTADGRVDFRELVKKLIKKFDMKIEMRQVGVRLRAKMCGGFGRCGRKICCAAYKEKFIPVSIKMAREQGLSLSPIKISGLCGRLMCCLMFEDNTYKALKKNFPAIGTNVELPQGKGKVISHNVISNKITIRLINNQEIKTELDELTIVKK